MFKDFSWKKGLLYLAGGTGALGVGGVIGWLGIQVVQDVMEDHNRRSAAQDAFDTAVATPEGTLDVRVGHFHADLHSVGEYGEAQVTHYSFQTDEYFRILPYNQRELFNTIYPGATKEEFDLATDQTAIEVQDRACIVASNLSAIDNIHDDVTIRTNYLAPYTSEDEFTVEYMKLMGRSFLAHGCNP
ncbi:MAG: hypothetical protein AAF549_08800 [Pseudomonadota bacterium]